MRYKADLLTKTEIAKNFQAASNSVRALIEDVMPTRMYSAAFAAIRTTVTECTSDAVVKG